MAKYAITYSCGHAGTTNIAGPQKYRAAKLARQAEGLCPDCYAEQRATERARAAQEAATKNAEAGLPPLTGTPKQIAWAEQIRQRLQPEIAQLQQDLDAVRDSAPADKVQSLDRAITRIIHETQASWWIDHRHASARQIATDEMKAYLK